jgi:hypothetical protein
MDAERPLQDYLIRHMGRARAITARRTKQVHRDWRQDYDFKRARTSVGLREDAVQLTLRTCTLDESTASCTVSGMIRSFLIGKTGKASLFEHTIDRLSNHPWSDVKRKHNEVVANDRAELLEVERVSPYLVARFGFAETCTIAACLPSVVASWISLPCSTSREAMLKLGTRHDELLMPSDSCLPDQAIPDPFSLFDLRSECVKPQKLLMYQAWKGAGKARSAFRRKYTKSWKAFKQVSPYCCTSKLVR